MKILTRLVAIAAALVVSGSAYAQKYPSKPVRIIIPFAAGGVTDIAGRVIAQQLSERLGQQFYIENQPGAGGNIGMGNAARAAGDGYTVLFASSSFVVNPSLYKKPPYDPFKDFIPVTKAGFTPNSWLVTPSFPAKSINEMIAKFKAEPGKISVASPGTGTTPSLSIEMFKMDLNLDFITVPFAGGGPATQSAIAGHTPIMCGALGNAVNVIKGGKLRALGITASKRSQALPDIPTLAESGIKGHEAETMTGVFVPAKTPKHIVELLQREISEIVKTPAIRDRLISLGVEPDGNTQQEFVAYIKEEIEKWRNVIEKAKINRI